MEMGRGGYRGGSTIIRPGSDWFSYKEEPRKKKGGKNSKHDPNDNAAEMTFLRTAIRAQITGSKSPPPPPITSPLGLEIAKARSIHRWIKSHPQHQRIHSEEQAHQRNLSLRQTRYVEPLKHDAPKSVMTDGDIAQFNRLIGATNVFRNTVDPEFYTQYVVVFLIICTSEELSIRELADRCGAQPPTMSRVVGALSVGRQNAREGYDLIETVVDPADRRRKFIRLTPKGMTLRNRLAEYLRQGGDRL